MTNFTHFLGELLTLLVQALCGLLGIVVLTMLVLGGCWVCKWLWLAVRTLGQ